MDYYLILYFFVGILQDFLVTLNWRYIAKHKIGPAMLLSFLVTITTMLVIYNILTKLDEQRSIVAIIIYASGVAFGTFLAMKFKYGFDDKK
jgi:ABC-type maltose transport system permease subunit